MSFVYLPESVADYSERNCLDSGRSAMLRTAGTVLMYSKPGSQMGFWMTPRSGMTLRHLTGIPGLDWWIYSQRVSHVNHSVLQVSKRLEKTTGISGRIPYASLEKSDRDSAYWRMSQASLPGVMDTLDEYSESFPRAGIMHDGALYRQPTWEHPISGKGSGYWPTPSSQPPGWKNIEVVGGNGEMLDHPNQRFYDKETGRLVQKGLEQVVKMWPTPIANERQQWTGNQKNLSGAVKRWPIPKAQDWGGSTRADFSPKLSEVVKWGTPTANAYKDSGEAVVSGKVKANSHLGRQVLQTGGQKTRPKGQLNPEWEDWLMGFPIGWTGKEPLETHKFREWLDSHGIY